MSIEYKTVKHRVGSGETIEAIIRSHNHQNIDKRFLQLLLIRFYEINSEVNPTRLGQLINVPIMLGF